MTAVPGLRDLTLPNPKVGPAGGALDAWYRYYAGYSSDFVNAIVGTLPDDCSVLDPWNGSGTTTVMAARSGRPSRGFDINPALVVVAKARLLGDSVAGSVEALATDIISHAVSVEVAEDPLRFWFKAPAVAHLRALQMSVHRLLISADDTSSPPVEAVDGMSSLAAFFYVALFRTVRKLVASTAGTNPTWWKPLPANARLNPTRFTITEAFRSASTELCQGLHGRLDSQVAATLRVGNSRDLPLTEQSVGAVVTSPPYCTRIDYAIATRPELAVLRASDDTLRSLRDSMVGTPTMTQRIATLPNFGDAAHAFLREVQGHPSKASGTYYLRYFQQYYASMWDSLSELKRVCRPGAPVVLVVQDSHYKDVLNDTPGILLDMGRQLGFEDTQRHDFAISRTKAAMNPRARKYRESSEATESVLVLS